LTLVACLSALAVSGATGYAFKTAVDAFALPLVAFYGARIFLKSPEHRRFLVVAAALLGLFLLGTGAFEFLTGINLLPYEGSEIIREGEPRVNGPFITDTSFAIVSLLLVLFLRSAPRMFNLRLDPAARLLYRLGIASAILACLLPLFRAVAIALAICWVIEGILIARPAEDSKADLADPLKAGSVMANPSSGSMSGSRSRLLQPLLPVAIVSALLVTAVIIVAPSNIRN